MNKETILVKGEDLLTQVLDVVAKGKVRNMTIADGSGREVITFPVTGASDGDLLPPILTVVSSLGDLNKECSLIIERGQDAEKPMKFNAMEIFNREAPDVAKAFDGLIQAISNSKGLDAKTKQLIYIAIKASKADQAALSFHVPMAKQLGATQAEVIDAILMTLTVSGITGVATCLPGAIACFEK
ncbi:MAG: carboxymuconolactone decarboxylase family protein [Taibaiella sp.]|jgi:alkylhydroperoxidase/carboxymuconolactone decarboxylase family protein YurZ